MNNNHQENQSTWARQEDIRFEYALTVVPEDCADRWEKIASYVPGKTADEVRVHYQLLVDDVRNIEAGLIELPSYGDDYDDVYELAGSEFKPTQFSFRGAEVKEKPRKKGTPWTKDEHMKFLEGLKRFGKGDWRSISRMSVVTRTPTQVASHAQKYFNRVDASPKERKRSSIHDITITATDTAMVQPPPTPGNLYVAQGAQLPAASPPSNLYNGQGVGKASQAPTSNFYSGQRVGKSAPPLPLQAPPTSNVYSRQGVGEGAPSLPPQGPTSNFYIGQGVGKCAPPLPSPTPTSNFYVGQGVGMEPQQQQQQQQQQQMGYGYQQNFIYPY